MSGYKESWWVIALNFFVLIFFVLPFILSVFRKFFSFFIPSQRIINRYENFRYGSEAFYRNKEKAWGLVNRYNELTSVHHSKLYEMRANSSDYRGRSLGLSRYGQRVNDELQEMRKAIIEPSNPAKIFFLKNITSDPSVSEFSDLHKWSHIGRKALCDKYADDENFIRFCSETAGCTFEDMKTLLTSNRK